WVGRGLTPWSELFTRGFLHDLEIRRVHGEKRSNGLKAHIADGVRRRLRGAVPARRSARPGGPIVAITRRRSGDRAPRRPPLPCRHGGGWARRRQCSRPATGVLAGQGRARGLRPT